MSEGSPFSPAPGSKNNAPGGTFLNLRLTPKASEDRIGPVVTGADGEAVLKVAVTAAPEHGKANKALIKLLAKSWRLPKGAVSVKKGASGRHKTLLIDAPVADVLKRVEANS